MRAHLLSLFKKYSFWVIVVSFTLTVGWFYRALFVGFLADDYDFLDYVLDGVKNGHPTWTLLTTSIGGASFFRPVINLTFLIDYKIFHLTPFGYHLTNLLFFGGSIALVVLIATRFIQSKIRAWIVAILFLVSPFTAESVVWISGRTDVVMLFFLLLSVWFFIYFRETARPWILVGIAGAALLSFFSKENGVVLVGVCILIDLFYFRLYRNFIHISWHERLKHVYPYCMLLLSLIVYFFVRYLVLGHWFYATTEAGIALFTFGSINNVVQFFHLFGSNIMHVRGFDWFGISRTTYFSIYGVGLVGIVVSLCALIVRRSWERMGDCVFGILLTGVFLAPTLVYVSLITNEHQDMRFVFIASLGVAWFITSVVPEMHPRKYFFHLLSFAPVTIILVIWGMASSYGPVPYVEAQHVVHGALSRVGDQILPDVRSVSSPGIYILGLPTAYHGAYAIPKHDIDRAMQLEYPDLADAEILNVGTHALHGSACAVQEGTRDPKTVFFYQYNEVEGYTQREFSRQLVGDREPLRVGDGFFSENEKIVFPIRLNPDMQSVWRYRGAPIDSTALTVLRIPLVQEHTVPIEPYAHIRWRFSSSFDNVKEIKNFFVTIPVHPADLARGYVEVQLCEYPLFFATPSVRAMSLEWRGLNDVGVTVGSPEFR